MIAPARSLAPLLGVALALALTAAGCASAQQRAAPSTDDPHLATAYRVLETTPLIDGHNDLPWAIRTHGPAPMDLAAYDLRQRTPGHTDIQRLREGRVGGQFWSVFVDAGAMRDHASARIQLEQLDLARRMVERYPDTFELATRADDVERIFAAGRIPSMLGMEGGHAIENSLGALRAYYDLGARYLTLTHSENIDWADSCCEAPELGGLSAFGEEVVREMNRLGMLVDLSHVSPATMRAALDLSEAPVIFSHSSARAVTDHPRNVPDDVLRRMPENGGVVMVTFVTLFVNEELRRWAESPAEERSAEQPVTTIEHVIEHIEHVRNVAGIDHVGLGSDFDGATMPRGLEDVSRFPALLAELSRRGWSESDLRKLAGENVLRVWREAERVAERLQAERPASVRTIAELDGPIPAGGGAFVTRLGDDTLALERFRYTPSAFEADVMLRVPETVLTRYRGTFDHRGRLRSLRATSYHPASLDDERPEPVGRASYRFGDDSVRVSIERNGEARAVSVPAVDGMLPFIDMVHWPYELAFLGLAARRAGAGTAAPAGAPVAGTPDAPDSVEIPMLVGARGMPFGFEGLNDAISVIRHPYRGTMTVDVDEAGRIRSLDAAGTTRKLVVERVDEVDVPAAARRFADLDARGGGIGELSGRAEAEGRIGDATVVVDYGVPRKRGREIFGALVPFGEVWRTGANRATHLSTDRDLRIGGERIPAGTYTLFSIPGPDGWTLIINGNTDITGTAHDPSADVARIPMAVETLAEPVEDLTILVDPAGWLRFRWDRTEAAVRVAQDARAPQA